MDHKAEFNAIWKEEFKASKFSGSESVFDLYWDDKAKEMLPWTSAITPFVLDPDVPLQVLKQNYEFQ